MQKLILIFAVAALAATGIYYSQQENTGEDYYGDAFTSWKLLHGKKYVGAEEQYRFNVFKSNLQLIDSNNELPDSDIKLGLNDFADLTNEEYGSMKVTNLAAATPLFRNEDQFTGEGIELASSVDWRTAGAVSSVKDQGSCGSCWTFSATGALEGAIFLRDGSLPSLSQQELVDCAGGEYANRINKGCNGGFMDGAFLYVIKNGITTDTAYPYKGFDGTCRKGLTPRYSISGLQYVKAGSQSALMAAINQQPVSVAIDATSIWFQFYKSGVFSRFCDHNLDHGVLVVGYGTEGTVDYYLVKNSYGTNWGENGYIKLVRNGDGYGQCGIQVDPSFPQ